MSDDTKFQIAASTAHYGTTVAVQEMKQRMLETGAHEDAEEFHQWRAILDKLDERMKQLRQGGARI